MDTARSRRSFGALAAAAVLACLLLPASASAAVIDAGELDVTTNATSGLQASYGGRSLFFGIGWSGFFLRFEDGLMNGRTAGPTWLGAPTWAPVSQSAVSRDGDVQSQTITYAADEGEGEVARVTQTTRVRDGARTFRVTYSVENRSPEALRFRALAGGDLYLDGSDGGTGVALTGPPRFAGGENRYTGSRGGVEEVLQSQLPGDGAPVAVAPWSARQQGPRYELEPAIRSASGLVDGVDPSYHGDTALAVQWDDHHAADNGLAPGETARYEVLWHALIPARLTLAGSTDSRYAGATHTITATLRDAGGSPVAGGALRWSVAGANPTGVSEPLITDADGRAEVRHTGERPGQDTITVFADADGDGRLDESEQQRTSSIYWMPRLSVEQSEWGTGRVGSSQAFRATLRKPDGSPLPNAELRWHVAGANPRSTSEPLRTDQHGEVAIRLTARHAGDDVLTVFADTDGDGVSDPGEPVRSLSTYWYPPPPQVVLERASWPTVPAAAVVRVTLRDEYGVALAGGALRWSADGVNPRAAETVRSSSAGLAELSLPGVRSGTGTVRVYFDRDEDGNEDVDEPAASVSVSWEPAPPPPVTRIKVDGPGLDVTVSSVGGLQARFDPLPRTTSRALFEEGYGGFYVRFFDGPLAGRTYGTSDYAYARPFYGDPQQAPERAGDTLVQRSSWTVRDGDVDVLRVRQVARVRDGEDSVRLTWSVENLAADPVRLRVGTTGDLVVEGNDNGTLVTAGTPASFVGIEQPSGFGAGIEGVSASRLPGEDADTAVPAWSRFSAGSAWSLLDAMGWPGGLAGAVPATTHVDAVGVEWTDRMAPGQGLAAAATARYETVWRLRRSAALRLSPPSAVAELRHQHRVTATLLDDAQLPRNGVTLRWAIAGAHPQTGAAPSAGLGRVVIAWTGSRVGRDELIVFADEDDDGVRDPDEAQRTVTVDWRTETAVDPPEIAPIFAPDGSEVEVRLETDGAGHRFFQVVPSTISSLPRCADGSPRVT